MTRPVIDATYKIVSVSNGYIAVPVAPALGGGRDIDWGLAVFADTPAGLGEALANLFTAEAMKEK